MQTHVGAVVLALALVACGSDTTVPYEIDRPSLRPRMVRAGAGAVPTVVRKVLEAVADDNVQVVVYVGASWCEPCKRFKRALAARDLDREFANVRFVEFDHDRDERRLAEANYAGRLIPRFVIPNGDGTGGPLRMEGSIKGPGGVANITPRLANLLWRASR